MPSAVRVSKINEQCKFAYLTSAKSHFYFKQKNINVSDMNKK